MTKILYSRKSFYSPCRSGRELNKPFGGLFSFYAQSLFCDFHVHFMQFRLSARAAPTELHKMRVLHMN